MTLLYFAIVLSLIVFVHELGHYIAARLTGVRVEVFSLGFGKRLTGWRHGDTDYRISMFPLGGYVRMSGIIDESAGLPDGSGEALTGADWEFMSKNWLQKIFILAAGGIMNFALAWFIFAILIGSTGINEADNQPVIGQVSPEWPAAEAGLLPGDRIISLNDLQLDSWEEISSAVHAHPGEAVVLTYERSGMVFCDTITTRAEQQIIDGHLREVGLIGIVPSLTHRQVGLVEACLLAGSRSYDLLRLSAVQLVILVR